MSSVITLKGSYFINGDIACAEGAIAAGCKFFAGYPITPATEITERMSERLSEVFGVYIQMEDELGAMAAILGASVTGVKSMTATSGPGFSLMMENIGLGMMMELPCVVVDVQRGGPSTGLPTLVGQQDMMQARWGSHGDYGVIAYCPSSPQEMFDYTVKAFNSAEKYRLPVFVMADEVVAHMTEKVVIPDVADIKIENRKKTAEPPEKYKPYLADEDLIPPMANAGDGYAINMTGLTHDERGYPVITAAAEEKLIKRLKNKIYKNADRIIEYENYLLDDAEIVIVAYGITSRCVKHAVEIARKENIKAGMLRLITAWPFPEKILDKLAEKAKSFIVPEINLGQMVKEVERVVGKRKDVVQVFYTPGELPSPDKTLKIIRELK